MFENRDADTQHRSTRLLMDLITQNRTDPPAGYVPDTREILSFSFHALEWPGLFSYLDGIVREKRHCQITVLNAHSIVTARRDTAFRKAIEGSQLVLCDSVPVLWLSRALGKSLPARLAGPDLCERLCRLAEKRCYSVFFLGATPAVLEKIVRRMKSLLPALRIAGVYSPPLREKFSSEECDDMVEAVNKASADILWVGLTAPKQEKWIYENLPRLNCKVAVGIGAAFDFIAGTYRRAPAWMQRAGLEWLFRFSQEPRRLWRRYVLSSAVFVGLSAKEIVKTRFFL
jgi:N-acetylglucosaminyldiphosphoundecaprenol N-acetyl-beta-D-mannosaminyltransferase